MIALTLDTAIVLTLRNIDRVRAGFLDVERDGTTKRVTLEPDHHRKLTLAPGNVLLTYSPNIKIEGLPR